MIEGSLEVKLLTVWTDGKSRGDSSQRKETIRRERVRRKKIQVREKREKSQNTVFFQCFVALEGRKVGSLSGGCGAVLSDERLKIARRCGAKHSRSRSIFGR